MMNEDHIEKILILTLKIISLLTKQSFTVLRSGDLVTIMAPRHKFMIPKKTNQEMLLEMTKKIMELLTTAEVRGPTHITIRVEEKIKMKVEKDGAVQDLGHSERSKAAMMEDQPMGGSDKRTAIERRLHPPHHPGDSTQIPTICRDVYLSSEEYPGGQKAAMMEGHPAGGSDKRTAPERHLHPPHPGDSTQTGQEIPHHGQSLGVKQTSVNNLEKTKVKSEEDLEEHTKLYKAAMMEHHPAGGSDKRTTPERRLHPPHHPGDSTQEGHPADPSWANKPPEPSPHPPYSWESTEDCQKVPHHGQKAESPSLLGSQDSIAEIQSFRPNKIKIHVENSETLVMVGQWSTSGDGAMVVNEEASVTSHQHSPEKAGSRTAIKMEEVELSVKSHQWPPEENMRVIKVEEESSRCGLESVVEVGKMETNNIKEEEDSVRSGRLSNSDKEEGLSREVGFVYDHDVNRAAEEHLMDEDFAEDPFGEDSRNSSVMEIRNPSDPPPMNPPAAGAGSEGLETVSCSECGMSFISEYRLHRHQRIHFPEGPFPCSECGKIFTQRRNLFRHLSTHSVPKPYQCPECGKCFSRKSYLVHHWRSHTEHGHDVANFSEEYSSDNGHDVVNPSAEYLAENGHEVANPSEEILLDNGHVVNPSEEYSAENGHDVANPSEEYLSDNGHDVVNPSVAYLAENGQNTANPLEDYWAEHGHDSANPSVEYSAANVHDTVNSSEEYWAEHGHDLANPSVEYSAGNLHEAVNSSEEYWAENGHNAANPSEEYYISSTEDEVEIEDPKSKSLGESSITVIIDPELCSPGHSPDPSNTNESSLDSMNRTANTPRTSRNNKFSCSECGKYFTSSYAFQTHQRVHTGERPFPCSVCGRRFTRKENLRRHERVHTGEKPFPCPQCGKRFSRKPYLADHLRTHIGQTMSERLIRGGSSGENPVTPAIVHSGDHLTNPSASISMAHNASELQNNSFSCSECGISFRWFSEFEKHWQTHSGEAPFSKEGHLQDRQTVNLFPGPYSCTECGVSFTDQSEAASHQLLHAGQQSGVTFMSELELDKLQEGHAMVDHTGHKPFSCWKCGEQFAGQARLDRHLALHAGEDMLICAVCGKTCRDTKDFSDHQRSHTNDRLFSCTECGLKFTTKSSLVQHSRGHSREHSIEHSGEKPYSCPECHFRCIRRLDLMIHLRSHTGEKPFSCSKCGKTFNQRSSLYSHHRTCCQ